MRLVPHLFGHDCLVIFDGGGDGALAQRLRKGAVPPKSMFATGALVLRKFCEILKGTYPSLIPLAAGAAAGADSPGQAILSWILR